EPRMDHLPKHGPVDRAPEGSPGSGRALEDELAGLARGPGRKRDHEKVPQAAREPVRRFEPAGVGPGDRVERRQPDPDEEGNRAEAALDRLVETEHDELRLRLHSHTARGARALEDRVGAGSRREYRQADRHSYEWKCLAQSAHPHAEAVRRRPSPRSAWLRLTV